MNILLADKLEQSALDGLANLDCRIVADPDLTGDTLGAALAEHKPDVLIVRSTLVPAEALKQANGLQLIIRAGAGVNNIDLQAAKTHGIAVANCPGKNAVAVAELAFALMLALDRFIPDCVADLRAGKWNKKEYSKGRGLFGQTLGVVGMGNIGQEMIPRAKAFGMEIIGYSSWMTEDDAANFGIKRAATLHELAENADIVSLHMSLRPETRGMIDSEFISKMKDGSLLINTSRAEVIDQKALLEAVQAGRIRAGLDVFEGEPNSGTGTYAGPLQEAGGIYCTHHIGASTNQAQEAVAAEVVRIVDRLKNEGIILNQV